MNYRYLGWLYYINTFLLGAGIVLLFAKELASLHPIFQLLGRAHLLFLHFPIVLFFVTASVESLLKNSTTTSQKDTLLLVLSCSTGISAFAGLLLSKNAGAGYSDVEMHQWLGIGMMVVTYCWYLIRHWLRARLWINNGWILAVSLLVLMVGHEGGKLTHGPDFLSNPFFNKEEALSTPANPMLYQDLVVPILKKKCHSCHNPQKSKGELDLSSIEGIQKGGKTGKLLDIAHPQNSLMLQRLVLPLESEKHMPPQSKPQLDEIELRLLQHWIKAGMSYKITYSELKPDDSLALACTPFLNKEESELPSLPNFDPDILAEINTNYCTVSRFANNSNALQASYFSSDAFDADQLKQLIPIKEQLLELNLSTMPFEDKDLEALKNFTALRKLNLSFTKIKGNTFSVLSSLKNLKELSLSGCAIAPGNLHQLQPLKQLRKLFLWNTGLNSNQINSLQKNIPATKLFVGYDGQGKVIQLPPPVITNEKSVFEQKMVIQLKHVMKGTTIRYTLDGSMPDSIKSLVFPSDGVKIEMTTHFQARAFMQGWKGSTTVQKHYFKSSIKADSILLKYPPNPQYAAQGSISLQDSKTGTTNFRTPNWLGFREQPFHALLTFKENQKINEVVLSSLNDIGSYIVPPALIRIKYYSGSGKWKHCYEFNPSFSENTTKNNTTSYNCRFPPIDCRALLIEVFPVAVLPKWHPGKGDKGWFFVDEVFIN